MDDGNRSPSNAHRAVISGNLVRHLPGSVHPVFPDSIITPARIVERDRPAASSGVTKSALTSASGLSRKAASKGSRLRMAAAQARLRHVAEIINRVPPRSGSVQ